MNIGVIFTDDMNESDHRLFYAWNSILLEEIEQIFRLVCAEKCPDIKVKTVNFWRLKTRMPFRDL